MTFVKRISNEHVYPKAKGVFAFFVAQKCREGHWSEIVARANTSSDKAARSMTGRYWLLKMTELDPAIVFF